MYIAIPSYNRSDVIEKKTLATLLEGGIKSSQIHFCCQRKRKRIVQIPNSKYNKIVVGKLGITHQRNFINHYFKEGDHVVSIDDDIEGLYKLIHVLFHFFIRNLFTLSLYYANIMKTN